MAHARLHMICGNCGSNDMFEYEVNVEIDDDTNEERLKVFIICDNCNTLHSLDDNAKQIKS